MAEPVYKKLPGKGLRSQGAISVTRGSSSLWLGENHLLQVDSMSGYVEEYKRFYFQDIQAIILRKTGRGLVWNLIFGGCAFLLCVFGLLVENSIGSTVLYSFAGLFVLFLLINAARGPTSLGHIKTAVQTEQLPSFNRLRNARKSLAILRPYIEQAQGALAPEEIVRQLAPAPSLDPFSVSPLSPSAPIHPPPLLRPYRSKLHLWFFGSLLFSGLIEIAHIYFHNIGFLALESLFFLFVVVLGIAALTKQHGTDLGKAIRSVTWASGVYLGILMLVGYIQLMMMGVSDPDKAGDQWSMVKKYAEFAPLETPWLLALLMANCAIASALGIAGLLLFRNWQHSKNTVTPPPPIPAEPVS